MSIFDNLTTFQVNGLRGIFIYPTNTKMGPTSAAIYVVDRTGEIDSLPQQYNHDRIALFRKQGTATDIVINGELAVKVPYDEVIFVNRPYTITMTEAKFAHKQQYFDELLNSFRFK